MKNVQENQIHILEGDIQYNFKQVNLLLQALTHSSYANEQQDCEHNERLEFLGDAVLELIVSKRLYLQFPEADEGQLTRVRARLVSEPALADLARALKLPQYIRLGKGEEVQGGRERNSLLSDVLEALIGAVYLDGGLESAADVLERIYQEIWPQTLRLPVFKDYKSRLQEMTQRVFHARPVYTLLQSAGPEHAKTYEVQVLLPDGSFVAAESTSVKKAEQKAAHRALDLLTSSL